MNQEWNILTIGQLSVDLSIPIKAIVKECHFSEVYVNGEHFLTGQKPHMVRKTLTYEYGLLSFSALETEISPSVICQSVQKQYGVKAFLEDIREFLTCYQHISQGGLMPRDKLCVKFISTGPEQQGRLPLITVLRTPRNTTNKTVCSSASFQGIHPDTQSTTPRLSHFLIRLQ